VRRSALAILSAGSLLAGAVLAVESARSRQTPAVWEFGGRWELRSAGGRVRIDNEPQRRRERERARRDLETYTRRVLGPESSRFRVLSREMSDAVRRGDRAAGDRARAALDSSRAKLAEAAGRSSQLAGVYARVGATPARTCTVGYVWLVATCALLPASWLGRMAVTRLRLRLRLRARRRAGLCRRCGYDLRASRERCPECGEPVLRWWTVLAAAMAKGAGRAADGV
jgi:hypothetical protein